MARSSFSEPSTSRVSFGESARSEHQSLLLSRERASTAASIQSERPIRAPPTWPAVLVSLLHNLSMGAAMNVWLEVCSEVVHASGDAETAKSAAQKYYGRLLAANAVCELITSQLVGVLSDKYGRRPIQILAQVGQVIDYSIAGLCLPTLGIVKQIPAETAEGLLFCSRGIAGFLGNYKVTLQSYTADISSAAECPSNLAALGAAMVAGMCAGSIIVAVVQTMEISFRACYFTSTGLNVCIILVVLTIWKDIAPRKNFTFAEANPLAGAQVLTVSRAMVIYSILVFLSSFALNMFVSTLDFYCRTFLLMDKKFFLLLGFVWALQSLVILGVLQPILTRRIGEIATLTLSFACSSIFYLSFSMLTPSTWGFAYVVIIFFSFGSMCYPIAVGLAARELPPQLQGTLQGAVSILETIAKIFAPLLASDVLIPMFENDGQFHGMVYLVAAVLLIPGVLCSRSLTRFTCHMDASKIDTNAQAAVEMQCEIVR